MPLTLVQASTIVDKALEKGRELGFKPLTVAVLDAGGHLTALKREDGSSLLRPEIAGGKAWGALGMGFGGREFARRAAGNPAFIQALSVASGGRSVPVPGGLYLFYGSGSPLNLPRSPLCGCRSKTDPFSLVVPPYLSPAVRRAAR